MVAETRRSLTTALLAVVWFAIIAWAIYDFTNCAAVTSFYANLPNFRAAFVTLPPNLIALPEVLWILFSGAGVGDTVCSALRITFRSVTTRLAAALAVGLILWTFALMAAGETQHLNASVLFVVLFAGSAYTIVRVLQRRSEWGAVQLPQLDRWQWFFCIATLGVLLVAMFHVLLGGLQPEIEFDAKTDHLAIAERYVQHGGFYNLGIYDGVLGFDFPQYQEYLYTLGFALFGVHAGKLVAWAMLLVAILAIVGFGEELFGSTLVGLTGALLFALTPIVSWSGATANTDLGQVAFFVLGLLGVLRWREERDMPGWLIFAGIMCGFAAGIKPFALANCVALGTAILALSWRRPVIPLLLFAAGVLVATMPSMLRTTALTGDPLFPAAANFLHSPLWNSRVQTIGRESMRTYGARTDWGIFPIAPWWITTHVAQYRDVVGPVILFTLPLLIVLAIRKHAVPALRVFGVVLVLWSLLWFASAMIEARYAMSLFPLFALAGGYAAFSAEARSSFGAVGQRALGILMLVMSVLNLQPFVMLQRNAMQGYVMGEIHYQWGYLLGCEQEWQVQLQYAPMLMWMNQHLDARHDRVYVMTDDGLYNLYSDVDLYVASSPGQIALYPWSLQSHDALARLRNLNIDYVLVTEGQAVSEQLGDHLRLVARTASTNPGQVDALFHIVNESAQKGLVQK